ncbi:TRAP dicarboxylate transporter DctP subunit [Jannaschia sp. CCS1]|nr:TRAP dicarboxylate transporter DctP subunit [Jannaschia sp. CCS1]
MAGVDRCNHGACDPPRGPQWCPRGFSHLTSAPSPAILVQYMDRMPLWEDIMQKLLTRTALATLALTIGTEAMATEWNVSLWGQRRAFTEHVERLAELVSERTDGEFTLNISYGGLSSNRENLDGISIGAFEMAQFCAGYHADKNPSITVLELPFLGVTSLEQEVELSMALYQHPAAIEDLARWNATLLMPSPLPQYNLVGVGDAPSSLADFEGLTVRATGGIGAAMSTVGAVPTSMSATEVRQAMDSGVVRAVSFAPHAHMSFGTIENATWWTTNLNPGTVNCPVVVNSDALASLSDEERDVLLGAVDEALDHYVANYNGATMDAWGPALEERNIEQVTFSEEELAAFREAAADPAAAAWIEDNAARGLPAQELYDFVTGMIAEAN